jgi:hypothetical protein
MNTHNYDIIGDVHGYATLLKKLLKKMGYFEEDGIWRHEKRTAIFVGDFINRGPEIRETLEIIKGMVDNGSALAILGNHEYTAILYHIKDSHGLYLNRHISGNRSILHKTLSQFKSNEKEWDKYLKWFRKLPLFLDLGKIRIAHAYWNDSDIEYLKENLPEEKLTKKFLREAHENGQEAASHIYKLLKGLEFRCPKDFIIKGSKGNIRKVFKMNWWESPEGKTFRDLSFGNKFILPAYTVPKEIAPSFPSYPEDKPIVFIGHYCLADGASILQSNICCVDSGVGSSGKLSAYRYSGETMVNKSNFISTK